MKCYSNLYILSWFDIADMARDHGIEVTSDKFGMIRKLKERFGF
jgi:hypothetical protein